MQIFDIMGPVMIGPSSSHTAGVVRLGNVARSILGNKPSRIQIQFHGSLAKTGKGHGSDKAVIAGLLGFAPDDERIRDSLTLADEEGISYSIKTVDLPDAHPNTVIIHAESVNGDNIELQGASVGGGNILVKNINGIEVSFKGRYDTLLILHNDAPGAISLVTNVLAVEQINIAGMKVYRSAKGGDAIMVIEADGKLDKSIGKSLAGLPHIKQVTVLSSIY